MTLAAAVVVVIVVVVAIVAVVAEVVVVETGPEEGLQRNQKSSLKQWSPLKQIVLREVEKFLLEEQHCL